MKVIYLGETDILGLIHGKIYEVQSIENSWYRILDESGGEYLFPPEVFEKIED